MDRILEKMYPILPVVRSFLPGETVKDAVLSQMFALLGDRILHPVSSSRTADTPQGTRNRETFVLGSL
jgi:hypothetical protein